MFTGIIEAKGTVKQARPAGSGSSISIDIGALADGTNLGDSIAVSGVCLTVGKLTGSVAEFDVSPETLTRSTLADIRMGRTVNLERAMSPTSRFGGHIVQGHIDGAAMITAIDKKGDFVEMTFSAGAELIDEIIPKGSVAIDGVSLTVSRMDQHGFTIALIPTTLTETTLGSARVRDAVNIETDIIVKTIKKQLANILPQEQGLTADKLKELGF